MTTRVSLVGAGVYGGDDPEVFGGPGGPLNVGSVPTCGVAEIAGSIIWIIEIDDK